MIYSISLNKAATEDLLYFKKTGNKPVLKKIAILLTSIEQTPCSGIGKPEQLKHKFSGYWSRRIDRENRLIYKILEKEKTVKVFSLKGHYE